MAGWCRLGIPTFGLIAKPLHAAIKGPEGPQERQQLALGVPSQTLGSWKRPVGYLPLCL